jgi:hypothetical protein
MDHVHVRTESTASNSSITSKIGAFFSSMRRSIDSERPEIKTSAVIRSKKKKPQLRAIDLSTLSIDDSLRYVIN